ncbi:MAG: TIGR04255 family protein [Patescibacteria group bacterium]
MTIPPFPNPPITEAIFDIRVIMPKETTLEVLLSFQDSIKDDFPVKKDRRKIEGGFQFGEDSPPKVIASSSVVDGYWFHSNDGHKIVQARLDGFTFNRLKPYSSWEGFNGEANKLWHHFIKIAKPAKVSRLALRYINRIELPLPLKDFKEYILTIPEIGPNIPTGLSDFLLG